MLNRFLAALALACLTNCTAHPVMAKPCLASFYGAESGNRTASGERFDPNGLTAAHRTLAFGTRLRVTYRGKSVVVRINDRGPFIAGRCIDLARGPARAIGLDRVGVAVVNIVPL